MSLYSFQTHKFHFFLESEAAFPYCNWSMDLRYWMGYSNVDIVAEYVNNWQDYVFFILFSLCIGKKFLKTRKNII